MGLLTLAPGSYSAQSRFSLVALREQARIVGPKGDGVNEHRGHGDLWIFGYGSLIWRPDFEYSESRVVWLHGWKRRFYQGSPDHRGTPESPGRVVTLLPEAGARCGGVAYRAAGDIDALLANLDHREKAGYERMCHAGHSESGETILAEMLVYVSPRSNPGFLGRAPIPEMAAHIAASRGPSGPNDEYLLRLDEALQQHGIEDAHVRRLAAALRELRGDSIPINRTT